MEFRSEDVGLRIKALRRQKKMTQIQLTEKMCYASERQVQRIENGESLCPTDRLAELAIILDTSTDYLLFGRNMNLRPEVVDNVVCMVVIVLMDTNCKQ